MNTAVTPSTAPRPVLIHAPAGYGKTRRLHELAAEREGSLVIAEGPGEVRAAMSSSTPPGTTIVADDIHTWPAADHHAIARIVTFDKPATSVMFAGRICEPRLLEALVFAGADVISLDDLRFGATDLADQLAHLDVSAEKLQILDELIDGWPLLGRTVVRHVIAADGDEEAPRLSYSHPLIGDEVDEYLGALTEADIGHLEQVAQLDAFSKRVAVSLSPGLLERLRFAGIPIESTQLRGLRLINPVREYLRHRSSLDHDVAPRMAEALLRSALPFDAIRLLIRTERSELAADMLAGLTSSQLSGVAPLDLLDTLDLLADQHARVPRLHLARARASEGLARLDDQLTSIEAAIDAADDIGDEYVKREAQAEQFFLRAMFSENRAGLLDEIEAMESHATKSHVITRLTDAKSLLLAQTDDAADMDRAIDMSERASRAWEQLSERNRAATTLRTRAMAMLIPSGRFLDADATIERALSLGRAADLDRLSSLVVAVRLDALLARDRPDRLSETAALAQGLGVPWAEAIVLWGRAMQRSVSRDLDGVLADFEHAWDLLGGFAGQRIGSQMLAEMAEALCRAGDPDAAAGLLERARPRRDAIRKEFAVAELALAARSGGDEDVARAADELDHLTTNWPGWRWKLDLYRAIAADDDSSRTVATASAVALATPWAGPGIVLRFEPNLFPNAPIDAAPRLGTTSLQSAHVSHTVVDPDPGADTEIDPSTGELDHGEPVRIGVLGAFTIHVGDRLVKVTSERVATMLKTLAIGRGRVPVEVALDRLWPDASGSESRRRLKNVMTRMRATLGPIVQRDADALVFADHVTIDLDVFVSTSRTATRALADDEPFAVAIAIQALALYEGALLPDDLYDDNIAPVRAAESCRAMDLIDALMASSAGAEVGSTIHDAIIRIDPFDSERLERFAEWAAERGSHGLARSAARKVLAIAQDFGDEPSSAVLAILGAH